MKKYLYLLLLVVPCSLSGQDYDDLPDYYKRGSRFVVDGIEYTYSFGYEGADYFERTEDMLRRRQVESAGFRLEELPPHSAYYNERYDERPIYRAACETFSAEDLDLMSCTRSIGISLFLTSGGEYISIRLLLYKDSPCMRAIPPEKWATLEKKIRELQRFDPDRGDYPYYEIPVMLNLHSLRAMYYSGTDGNKCGCENRLPDYYTGRSAFEVNGKKYCLRRFNYLMNRFMRPKFYDYTGDMQYKDGAWVDYRDHRSFEVKQDKIEIYRAAYLSFSQEDIERLRGTMMEVITYLTPEGEYLGVAFTFSNLPVIFATPPEVLARLEENIMRYHKVEITGDTQRYMYIALRNRISFETLYDIYF